MPTVTNTDAGVSGRTLDLLESNQTITGLKTFDRGTSTPFGVVAGAAKVDNLDADKLDGEEGADFHNATLLASGTVPTARLGSGSPSAATVLLGDSSWATLGAEQVYASTGAQADVAPTAAKAVLNILCTGAAPAISGFSGGAAGRVLILHCLGTTLQVTHQGVGSAEANRIICPSTNGQIVGVNGVIALVYDVTNSRWRAILLDPGAPIVVSHAGGNFTASAGSWTVDAGDQTSLTYQQRGKMVRMQWVIVTTDVSATPASLNIAVPNSFTAAREQWGHHDAVDAGGTPMSGAIRIQNAASVLELFVANWIGATWSTTAADNTATRGSFDFEVS